MFTINYCCFSWQLGCGLFFWQLGCGVFVFGKLGCGGFFGARRNFLTSGKASKIFDAGVPRYASSPCRCCAKCSLNEM